MKIKLLDIRGFGRFSNRKIIPAKGFNLVFGNNESGKSTLADFIQAMLFGFKPGKRARGAIRESGKSYRPWNSDAFSGVMECELDSGPVFRIDRNFDRGTTHIRDESGIDVSEQYPLDRDTGPRFAEERLKVNATVFERSAMIRQMRSAVDDAGREVLLEKLSNLNATGAEDQSASKALDALNSALLEKVGTGRSTTRPLDKVQDRLSELEKEKERIIGLNERYLDTALLLKSQKNKLRELRVKLAELAGGRDSRLEGRLLEIRDESSSLGDRLKKLQSDFNALNAKVKREERFGEMTELSLETLNTCFYEYVGTVKRIGELSAERERLHEALTSAETRMAGLVPFKDGIERIEKAVFDHGNPGSEAAAGNERPARISFLTPVSALIAVMAAAAFIFSLFSPDGIWRMLQIPSGVLFLAGLLILLIQSAVMKRRRSSNSGTLIQKLADEGFSGFDQYLSYREGLRSSESIQNDCWAELERVMGVLASLEGKRAELAQKIGVFLGVSDTGELERGRIESAVESYKSGYREYREDNNRLQLLGQDIGACEQKLEALLREASVISKRDIRNTAEIPIAVSGSKSISGRQPAQNGSPVELEELIGKTEDAIKTSELEAKALETRLENIPPLEALAAIDEENALLREKKERLEAAGESLSLAIDIIRQVSREHQKNYTTVMNEKMGEMVSRITGGRYSGISAGPGLGLSLETPETEELVPINQLSGATVDQVYLAMRIAALNILERGGETIPLILDEPFSQYDEDRLRTSLQLLKKIASNRQVFFLTCRKREADLAREIFGPELNPIIL